VNNSAQSVSNFSLKHRSNQSSLKLGVKRDVLYRRSCEKVNYGEFCCMNVDVLAFPFPETEENQFTWVFVSYFGSSIVKVI
jgi:hypothetical protein